MLIYTHLTAPGPALHCVCVCVFHQFELNRTSAHTHSFCFPSDILHRVATNSSSVGNICSTDIPQ